MPAHNTLQILMRTVMVHIFSPLAGHDVLVGRMVSGLIVAAGLAIGGCASVPPPDNAMNLAQGQLQAARDAQAADYAPVDLGFAQDKFQQAQAAMAQRHYADAAKWAEESRADAELARAKARLAAAREQIQGKLAENTRLRQQGEQAASPDSLPPATSPPAADGEQGVLPEQPQDMPAPAASRLSAPPAADGFQTVPESTPPAAGGFQPVPAQAPPTDNGHPASAQSDGGQP
jgi:hypothetical protein